MDKDDLITDALRQFEKAKDEFREAHQAGMDALNRGDYHAVAKAIAKESAAIEKQRALTARFDRAPFRAPLELSAFAPPRSVRDSARTPRKGCTIH